MAVPCRRDASSLLHALPLSYHVAGYNGRASPIKGNAKLVKHTRVVWRVGAMEIGPTHVIRSLRLDKLLHFHHIPSETQTRLVYRLGDAAQGRGLSFVKIAKHVLDGLIAILWCVNRLQTKTQQEISTPCM